MRILFLSVAVFAAAAVAAETAMVGGSVRVELGAVNAALIERGGETLAVYGAPADAESVDTVLFTHHRRDAAADGIEWVQRGAEAVVPAAEADSFAKADKFWREYVTKRFHDYMQQSSKILTESIQPARTVSGGDAFEWNGLAFEVLSTPGYTRGAVTYLCELDSRRVAFTGDLIYGDGKIIDIYSLQDAIPEAKIRGYHGYAGRIADVIASLRKLEAAKPDVLVPARGPVIEDPAAAVTRLVARLQAVYRNYLSTNALLWYFGEEHIQACADRVFGEGAGVEKMGIVEQVEENLPEWLIAKGNTRLLVSKTGRGFLLDCGYTGVIEWVNGMIAEGELTQLDGIYITHYHDDHTDQAGAGAAEFGCPVYATQIQADILRNPSAYRMPALTGYPIKDLTVMGEGVAMKWNEFTLTFMDYPGQTLYHGGLLVEHADGTRILFAGDSFTPSGIDDYCLLNRNLMHDGMGYFYCLDALERMAPGCWIVNQHVEPLFRYTPAQIEYLRGQYAKRRELLADLFPWDDPNYGIDEQWARLYPYGQTAKPGGTVPVSVVLFNHSPGAREFRVRLNAPAGWGGREGTLVIPPREEASLTFEYTVPGAGFESPAAITADIESEGMAFREWCEAMVVAGE